MNLFRHVVKNALRADRISCASDLLQPLQFQHAAVACCWKLQKRLFHRTAFMTNSESVSQAEMVPMHAKTIWAWSMPTQPQVTGKYSMLDRTENGQPVWRQDDGPGWLYLSNMNIWWVTPHEECVGKTGGIIGGIEVYNGTMPQDWEQWQRYDFDSQTFIKDFAIVFSADENMGRTWEAEKEKWQNDRAATLMDRLELRAPEGFAKILGPYERVTARNHNSQPVWRQSNGPGWLYGDCFGHWHVADDESKLEFGIPTIKSTKMAAPFLWPHEVTEWSRDGGGCGCSDAPADAPKEWTLDNDITFNALTDAAL